jgi:triose/dihydroxyacetone kinase / FAD-AMP lyase (cyclizing)
MKVATLRSSVYLLVLFHQGILCSSLALPSSSIDMKPKKFINSADNAVDEFISGLLLQYPNHLRKLANHHVILHSSFATSNKDAHPNKARVSLLSGGGSGHEPSHAGFVGENMLSGAILGGIFASPSVSSILAAIRASTLPSSEGGKGCLLIVKNYTGDRLNFGIACEKANAEGRLVKMVVVADDCAIERKKGITGARGVAGTVFVHKAAGGAAGKGMDLDEVTSIAETVSKGVGSLGCALNTVTIPGADKVNDRLSKADDAGEPMMEIGLGIHGEAGKKQCPLMSCDDIAKEMLSIIQTYGREVDSKIVPLYNPSDKLIVLVNNLGGTSNFEMSLLTRSLVTQLEAAGCKATRVLVGSFMTSFDMQGASVSILPCTGDITKDVLELFDASTDAPGWLAADVWNDGESRPSASEIEEVIVEKGAGAAEQLPPVLVTDYSTVAQKVLAQCAQALSDAEPTLTEYDTIVGDGDCGITMQRGAKEVLSRLESKTLRVDNPVNTFADLADAVSASMGGSSGILLELMFRKMSTSLQSVSGDGITPKDMAVAFRNGCEAVSFYGGAQEGSRTMLDAMFPASAAMLAGDGADIPASATAAQKGADATAAMTNAEAGRSNYLSEEVLMGTPDPGAVAVALVLGTLAKAFA